VILEY
jgi:hypothetical protein